MVNQSDKGGFGWCTRVLGRAYYVVTATLIGSRDRVNNGIAKNTVLWFSKNHPHFGPQVSLLSYVTHIDGFIHAEPQLVSKKYILYYIFIYSL